MVGAGDPGDRALDAHAEPAMGDAPVAPQVDVPLVVFQAQPPFENALLQEVGVVNPLASADDFPIAFGGQQVGAQGHFRPLRVGLHIKGLGPGGVFFHKDRPVELAGDQRLVGCAQVLSPGEGGTSLDLRVMPGDEFQGFVVGDAGEGRHDPFQRRGIALQDLQFPGAAFQAALDDVGDKLLLEAHVVLVGVVGHLRFDHPELGQVAAGLALFGPEGRPEAIDLAERHHPRLDVQLPGLGQVGRAQVEVGGGEEGAGALGGAGGQNGRIEADEAALVQVFLGGRLHLGADAQEGVLFGGAHPEVAVFHQKADAVLLGGDRVIPGDLYRLDGLNRQFIAARSPPVGAHPPGDDQGGFLGQRLGGGEGLGGDLRLEDDALNQAAAVAHQEKDEPALFPLMVKPPAQGDFLPFVTGDFGNGNDRCHGKSSD